MLWHICGRMPSRVPIRTKAAMLGNDNAINNSTTPQRPLFEPFRIEVVEAPQKVDAPDLAMIWPDPQPAPLVELTHGVDDRGHRATPSHPIHWGAVRAAVPSLCPAPRACTKWDGGGTDHVHQHNSTWGT